MPTVFTPSTKTVVIAVPKEKTGNSAANKLADELQRSTMFDWSTIQTDAPTQVFPKGTDLAVIAISADVESQTSNRVPHQPAIAVVPGRIEQEAQLYARLVQLVSQSASRAGVTELFEEVSGARIKLNVASITTAGIDGALAEASASLDEAIRSFTPVVSKSEPLIANARQLLNSYQSTAQSLTAAGDKLSRFARDISSLDATLGDLRDGTELSEDSLSALRPVLLQGRPLAESIAESLNSSGSRNLQLLGSQLNIIVQILGIEADTSSVSNVLNDISAISPEDLSALLGTDVHQETKVSDFLLIAANRLLYFGSSITEARRIFDGAAVLFDGVKTDLSKTRADISAELERFKRVVSKLSQELDAATKQLPDTSQQAVDSTVGIPRMQVWSGHGMVLKETLRAALVIMSGALMIALIADNISSRGVRFRWIAVLFLCSGLSLLTVINMKTYGYIGFALGVAIIAIWAMVELFCLLMMMFGQWGYVVTAALIGLGLVDYTKVPVLEVVENALPSYFLATSLRDATFGLCSGLVMTVAVVAAVGSISTILRYRWKETAVSSTP
jgi:hypothetical protein